MAPGTRVERASRSAGIKIPCVYHFHHPGTYISRKSIIAIYKFGNKFEILVRLSKFIANIIYSFPPILRYSIHLSEISVGSYSHIDIVVSQPLTAACDLGLQAVVSHPLTSIKCVALL